MIEYDPSEWRSHLFDIRGSMAREILARVMACTAFSVVVVLCDKFVHPIKVPLVAHTLIGLALGLLLVFRTNVAYDRYWEGRKLWGSMINASRNLGIITSQFLEGGHEIREAVGHWTIAFAYATMNSLRGRADLGPVVDRLPADQVRDALAAPHVPLEAAHRIGELISDASRREMIGPMVQVEMLRTLESLVDQLGGCERIRKTPLPFVYVVHLRRALIIYSVSLPLALVEAYGWATIFVVMILAYVLFGIEEIGVEIENPFGHDINDLPLEGFCATIDRDVSRLLIDPRLIPTKL